MALLLDPITGRLHFSIISLGTEHIPSAEETRAVTPPSTYLILSKVLLPTKD